MRSKNSIINTFVSIIMNIINIIISFCVQTIFIKQLGAEYNGINGLFLNIISMLSIIEMGIGSAIIYNLYEPVAKENKEEIKSLMKFYQKSYHIIGIIVFSIGVCIIPFINNIVGSTSIKENIQFIFFLFILDTTCSYLLSYKRSILYADQKAYIVNIIHIGYILLMNILQIILLITTNNYIIYLIVKIIFRILENMVITIIANKRYAYIKEKDFIEVSAETKNNIINKVKGLFLHKIGMFIVLGTDNIIISKFLGIITVGLYANYNMILNALTQILGQMYSAITASIGNLLVEKNTNKSYITFKRLNFFNYITSSFFTICFYVISTPFIKIWLGEEFLLSNYVVAILAINFYIQAMRKNIIAFKDAAGLFYEDRFVPIIESIVNIIASIILVKYLGLCGVFIGTIISTLIVYIYSYPKYVYIPLFNRSRWDFLKQNIYYMILFIIQWWIIIIFIKFITIGNIWIDMVIKLIICVTSIIILDFIMFRKKEEYKYFVNLINNLTKNIFNKMIKKKSNI